MIPELCQLSAIEQQHRIASRALSCEELLLAHLAWIDHVNPAVNAICTLTPELALDQARRADARLARGEPARPLEGLCVVIKDLVEVEGVRTTHGSPLYRDHVSTADALHVARIRQAGGVVIGKSNTPEWGAGSQTFNTLFGVTATPYDLSRTSGGSSGGAAAALAARMVPIADGSDLGGSLRNPAAFCNVVGFRPTPGRVPALPNPSPWNPLPVLGPMGRTVADTARLLSVMAGPDIRAPLSLAEDPGSFAEPLGAPLDPDGRAPRLAWTADLGFLPVAEQIRAVAGAAIRDFEVLGCRVEESTPDLQDAPEAFQILRAHQFATRFGSLIKTHAEDFKDTIHWNTSVGLEQTVQDLGRAESIHADVYRRMLAFFEDHDFLLLPATQTPPFDKGTEWVREIEGVAFQNYLQWMEICCVISLTGCPAVSVPCGFTPEGLPVGLQIVGPPRADLDVLQLAHRFEQATRCGERLPEL